MISSAVLVCYHPFILSIDLVLHSSIYLLFYQCWGLNLLGSLGLGDSLPRGDEPGEMGDDLPAVSLGTGAKVALPTLPTPSPTLAPTPSPTLAPTLAPVVSLTCVYICMLWS